MASIYPSTKDGYISSGFDSTWIASKQVASGTYYNGAAAQNTVGASALPARGGGARYPILRAFFYFDTSMITALPPTATLKLYGYGFSSNNTDFIVVKSGHPDPPTGGDFDSITGWVTDTPGNVIDNESNITAYSSVIDAAAGWSTSGYNDVTLNAQAKETMHLADVLAFACVEFTHDVKNVSPGSPVTLFQVGWWWTESSGTSRDPYIEFEHGVSAAADNATFFGANF